ncbi:MAG: hypothetical protein IJM58_03130 [Muribaculaceae bacterium]|nr:hypothetical protein [Muribaculaceae bacterium]
MANKRVEEICYYCKFAKACGWHLWHCTKHDEQVSEQSTSPDWEEE